MTEREMLPTVLRWINDKGYLWAREILLVGHVDVVAFRFAERAGRAIPPLVDFISIELKVDDYKGVLYQTRHNLYIGPAYAAMPADVLQKARPQTIERFRKIGVGLLSVGDGVDTLLVPADSRAWENRESLRKKLWRHRYYRESDLWMIT